MKGFADHLRAKAIKEGIFIGQGSQLQDPIPGTQVTDSDLAPTEKQNKFKKKNKQAKK